MSVLYFGDVAEYLANAAKSMSPDAVLIDERNCRPLIISQKLPPVSYTALGDLPKDMKTVYRLLDMADEIVYFPPERWSDDKPVDIYDPSASIKGLSDLIMLDFHKAKNNVRLPHERVWFDYRNWNIDRLEDKRRHDGVQLWVSGCSFTYGTGVDPTQRYGQLLANRLNLPVSWLATPGSSVEWAADQILRSDIRAGDLVVWGLTGDSRVAWWDSKTDSLMHITIRNIETNNYGHDISDSSLMEILMSDSRLYKSIISTKQVINYCRKINAKLLIAGLLSSHAINLQLSDVPEFEPFITFKNQPVYLDLGTDEKHPGPRQHQVYAEFCYEQMKLRGYI